MYLVLYSTLYILYISIGSRVQHQCVYVLYYVYVYTVQYSVCIVRGGGCSAENAFPVERRGARKLNGLYARADPLCSVADASDSDLRTALRAALLKFACTTRF